MDFITVNSPKTENSGELTELIEDSKSNDKNESSKNSN